jgi:hypothetical protein
MPLVASKCWQKLPWGKLKVPAANHSIFDQVLDESMVRRVEALMATPYDQLSESDAQHRLVLGTQRARARLSSNPLYAKKEARSVALTGSPWAYWSGYWMSGVNTLDRPLEPPTAE